MFPMTNKRQHRALVQSALQKIRLYQMNQYQILLQQEQREREQQQQQQEINMVPTITKPLPLRRTFVTQRLVEKPNPEQIVVAVDEKETVLSEVNEAIEKQSQIESELVTQTAEIKEQFVAEFAEIQTEEESEISLQIDDEEE